MTEKSKRKKEKPDFKTLIPSYSDEKIREILAKRKYYQPEAEKLAVGEAVKRGIINSEEDLFAEGSEVKPMEFSIFPAIRDAGNAQKIRKSISRMMIVSGAIPVIYGVFQLKKAAPAEAAILIVAGLLWIFLSALIFRKMNKKIVAFLFVLLILSAAYLATILFNSAQLTFMDIFVALVFYLLFGYGLLYLRRLEA